MSVDSTGPDSRSPDITVDDLLRHCAQMVALIPVVTCKRLNVAIVRLDEYEKFEEQGEARGDKETAMIRIGEPKQFTMDKLSRRERQVFSLLVAGVRISEMANLLHRSPKTVSTYRARILEKLGATSDSEVVRYAVQNNLMQAAFEMLADLQRAIPKSLLESAHDQ